MNSELTIPADLADTLRRSYDQREQQRSRMMPAERDLHALLHACRSTKGPRAVELPYDLALRLRDELPQLRHLAREDRALQALLPSRLQPCAACGELSPKRWCSASCHRAEDGGW